MRERNWIRIWLQTYFGTIRHDLVEKFKGLDVFIKRRGIDIERTFRGVDAGIDAWNEVKCRRPDGV